MQSNLCGKATVGTDLKYPSRGYLQLYESRGNVTPWFSNEKAEHVNNLYTSVFCLFYLIY